MPKLIDYPRTSYAGAWEVAEITDDTGGKCTIETAARKLNRKVSGSFKAIIGSAVKFGLLTSKRELLTTTTLFKRIKHAYDKQEELVFHREAFLTPPLFTQLCRKFRSRELPIQMLDVMLIREFGVEEINAQGVAKAFVDGCRMAGLLDERNIIADIDALASQRTPHRELASPAPTLNTFRDEQELPATPKSENDPSSLTRTAPTLRPASTAKPTGSDAIASLFGLLGASQPTPVDEIHDTDEPETTHPNETQRPALTQQVANPPPQPAQPAVRTISLPKGGPAGYQIQVSGPGLDTTLSITEEEDIVLAMALLEKIRRQLKA